MRMRACVVWVLLTSSVLLHSAYKTVSEPSPLLFNIGGVLSSSENEKYFKDIISVSNRQRFHSFHHPDMCVCVCRYSC